MTTLTRHAAWVLLAAFTLSLAYELYRVVAKRGVSRHDTVRAFVQESWLYVAAAIVIVGLFAAQGWAAWAGLGLSVASILVSIGYYNPVILLERRPGLVDWIEDLVFTGLLFVAAALLGYEVLGFALEG